MKCHDLAVSSSKERLGFSFSTDFNKAPIVDFVDVFNKSMI